MEEINLFNELNLIKNEIERDLSILNKFKCDLMMKTILERNKELTDKIAIMQNEFETNKEENKNANLSLKKEIERKDQIIEEKEIQIRKLNENLKNVIEENRKLNVECVDLTGENKKLNKKLETKETKKELDMKNKSFIRNYYENFYK